MGGPNAIRTVEKGAETPVWLATEPDLKYKGCLIKDFKIVCEI
jgi:hypothetical protein